MSFACSPKRRSFSSFGLTRTRLRRVVFSDEIKNPRDQESPTNALYMDDAFSIPTSLNLGCRTPRRPMLHRQHGRAQQRSDADILYTGHGTSETPRRFAFIVFPHRLLPVHPTSATPCLRCTLMYMQFSRFFPPSTRQEVEERGIAANVDSFSTKNLKPLLKRNSCAELHSQSVYRCQPRHVVWKPPSSSPYSTMYLDAYGAPPPT